MAKIAKLAGDQICPADIAKGAGAATLSTADMGACMRVRANGWTILITILAALLPVPAHAAEGDENQRFCSSLSGAPVCIESETYSADVCRAIARYAERWKLPDAFLARLIWQESRFDPTAISPAGAQGIAQFMPGTARLRTLENPFDPAEALARSAEYLRFLERKYGNLGLAAAAYNSGEGRVSRFVDGSGGVPLETREYVAIITGHSIEYWLDENPEPPDYTLHPELEFEPACIKMAEAVPMPDLFEQDVWQPWGILIAQNYSQGVAREAFQREQADHAGVLGDEILMLLTVRNPKFGPRTRYSAMVGRQTRAEAQELCTALLADGGNCIVQRNE
jgi:hypothetical protein